MDNLGLIVLIICGGVILSRASRMIGKRLFNTSRFFERDKIEDEDGPRKPM